MKVLVLAGVLALRIAPPPSPSPEATAEALFRDGEARYETHDYTGAIEAFTAAYAEAQDIADVLLRDEVLSRLAFNLGRAHVDAFDVDGDVQHLVLARKLIADYRGHERALGRDPDDDTDVLRLEADLAERERSTGIGSDGSGETGTNDAEPSKGKRNAGISLLVLAAPLAGVAIAGGVIGSNAERDFERVTTGSERLDARSRGRTGNVLLGVGVGLAVASAASGVALLGVSMQGKRARVQAKLTGAGFLISGVF